MFAFDMFKDEGGRLRVIAMSVAAGMMVLLSGLWFVQIVSARKFENNLRRQSFRTVRIPSIRGKILDRNGLVLADDLPRYNANLYLEDLQGQFREQYDVLAKQYGASHPEVIRPHGRMNLSSDTRRRLQIQSYCDVVSNITYRVSVMLQEPRLLNSNAFVRHYNNYPYVPFQIVPDLGPKQVAIFAEQLSGQPALELETQPARYYPHHTLAAHLLGFVRRRDPSEAADISFTLPDYEGASGVERVCDEELRGQAGLKLVLVNNLNYRQRENVELPNHAGQSVYLTIDLPVQRAAEQALAAAQAGVRGAVVVMDPRNGDILALVSAPAFDPNEFVPGHGMAPGELERLNNGKLSPELNRAVTGAYPPGSTFKIITSIACLENGLDPKEIFDSPGEYRASPNARPIADLAEPGPYDFERAFFRSCNTYFIHYGLKAGLRNVLEVAHRFHLGEKTRLQSGQEASAGTMPRPDQVGRSFPMSSAADVCIGQEVTTTPLQMACVLSVIANGGTLYWPRDLSRAYSPETGEVTPLAEQGRVRDHVAINPVHLEILRSAMLADTEHAADSTTKAGTAYAAFHEPGGAPYLGTFRVAGKTGTAQVKSPGSNYRRVTWFDSYGPYEDPRYVVVVMVEDGGSGGLTCAPVARKIYQAIVAEEQSAPARTGALAHN
ncbi:MAG: penicillin-binding transpeptidase domain-containing protein [Verrucomicrobiota bacterium]|jgi:penicillin-binding protein 2